MGKLADCHPWALRVSLPPQGFCTMLIFDAHLDLAWNALDWNRDLRLPCEKIRQIEKDAGYTDKGRGCNTVTFPDLRRGKVCMVIATLLPRLLRIGAMPAIQRYAS